MRDESPHLKEWQNKPAPLNPPKRYSFVPRDAKPDPMRADGTVPLTSGVIGVQVGNAGSNDMRFSRAAVCMFSCVNAYTK